MKTALWIVGVFLAVGVVGNVVEWWQERKAYNANQKAARGFERWVDAEIAKNIAAMRKADE